MKIMIASLALAAALIATPAASQQSSYKPGSVWQCSDIKVEPGQFENYMDFLSGQYKRSMEMEKQMGYLVSYHVFSVNDPRPGEPNLVLCNEYKDYLSNAQQLALQDKMMAALASDPHKFEAASGERGKMRTEMGSMEMQELMLK